MFNEQWPILPDIHDTECTSNLVSILLGHGTNLDDICSTVPNVNATFVVDCSKLKNADDVKCDDGGSLVNNGVRKLYMTIENVADPKLLHITTIK